MNYKKTIVTTLAVLGLAVAPLTSEAAQFKDVPANASYKEAVEKLVQYKVLGGYSDGTFKPHAPVTRAQAASIMAKALALDLSKVQAPGFRDVSATNGHYTAIAKLTELGVFSRAEKFNPNSPITRVQMAKMLVEAFDLKANQLQTFTDVKKTAWYYEPAGILGALQITRNAEKFEPAGLVTRAHFATFVERVITMKRADGLPDIWDAWGNWDERGVIAPLVEAPVKQLEKQEEIKPEQPVAENDNLVKETNTGKIQRLKTMISELEDAKEDVADAYEGLKEAIEKKKKQKTIDVAKKDLSAALQTLDKQLMRADDLIEQADVLNDAEVENMLEKLRTEIRRATKVSIESYAETFDKEYYEERLEDAADDLADAIKDANKGLKNKSFGGLKDAHTALRKQIEAAESARESYRESSVKTLQDADRELADSINEAEDLLEEIEEWFEDRLSEQYDNFKDFFKEALDELDDALDDGKKSKIYDAKEEITKLIERAEKIVDDYKDVTFDGIQKDVKKLQKEIDDAEKELRDAD